MVNKLMVNVSIAEMLYKAMLCVLKNDGISFDDKHDDLWNQIITYTETESADLLDFIDPFYQYIKVNTQNDYLNNGLELDVSKAEMIYIAMLSVLKHDGIQFDNKHDDLMNQIITYKNTSLLKLIEPFYQYIKANTQYDEFDKEDEE